MEWMITDIGETFEGNVVFGMLYVVGMCIVVCSRFYQSVVIR